MNIKVVIIENLRQIQIDMIHRSYRNESSRSSLRGQGRVLSILLEESEISRAELGERMQMSRAAMAELLGKMEKSGLITRSRTHKDRRRVDIKLTDAGRAAAENMQLGRSDLPEMLNCLNIEELNRFNDYLERIIEYNRSELDGEADTPAGEDEIAEIEETVVKSICRECPGPEFCRHDYLKYGHDRPNPDYCKYADQFPFE